MSDELPADAPALVPVREQTVDFYGDHLPAGQVADGTIWVPLRPICTALGLGWGSQYNRIQRDPVLAAAQGVFIMKTPGGDQRQVALPLKLLPGWLFGISASRVKPELRAKIERYQADCYEVLWTAFKGDILPPPARPSTATGAALALEIAEAIAALARQQLDLEARLDTMAGFMRPFVQTARHELADHAARLSALELQVGAGVTISKAQASEIALAVKNVGGRLTGSSQREGYAQVYAELYRRYRISGYKNLPAAAYDEVIGWLHSWYTELAEDGGTHRQEPGDN